MGRTAAGVMGHPLGEACGKRRASAPPLTTGATSENFR